MSTAVLLVCLGNICRSPTAHGVLAHKVAARRATDRVRVDSAGTGDWHAGEPPDARTRRVAAARGYDLSMLRARPVVTADFERFDYILAMDRSNLAALQGMRPVNFGGQLDLFLRYATRATHLEVPDPYYGGERGFEDVLDLVEDAAEGLLAHLLRE